MLGSQNKVLETAAMFALKELATIPMDSWEVGVWSCALAVVAERVVRMSCSDSHGLAIRLAFHVLPVDVVVAFCMVFRVLRP